MAEKVCKLCAKAPDGKCKRHGGAGHPRQAGHKPLFQRPRKNRGEVSEHLINAIDALKREKAKIDAAIEQLEGMLT